MNNRKEEGPSDPYVDGNEYETDLELLGAPRRVKWRMPSFGDLEAEIFNPNATERSVNVAAAKRAIVALDGEPVEWARLHPVVGAALVRFGAQIVNRGLTPKGSGASTTSSNSDE